MASNSAIFRFYIRFYPFSGPVEILTDFQDLARRHSRLEGFYFILVAILIQKKAKLVDWA